MLGSLYFGSMYSEPLRILLADDDADDRLLFKEALSGLKIKTSVETVKDGVELMEFLAQKTEVLPQLIFLDLNMPKKNGFECLKEIKSIERYKDISIAIYSTSTSEHDINETFILGANVYLSKPGDFETLKALLAKAVIASSHYEDSRHDRSNFLLKL
jgi:CheY-like chemotaxis protein